MEISKRILSIALTVMLCACSNGENSGGNATENNATENNATENNASNDTANTAGRLSGTYGDNTISYEFTPKRVYLTAMGATSATNYEIDGNRVLVGMEGGQQVLMMRDDGSLEGPMGIILQKQRSAINPADKGTYPDKLNLSSPSDVAEAYLLAMANYEFSAAFDNTTMAEEIRSQPQAEFDEAAAEAKAAMEAEGGITEFRIVDQQIDGNNAVVKVESRMGNGKTSTESFNLIKLDGRWLLD